MKNIAKEKGKILIESGYADEALWISAEQYSKLNETEKQAFAPRKGEGSIVTYYKKTKIPEYTKEEFETILKLYQSETLSNINKDIKTIKKCVLFFTIFTIISLISYLIVIMNFMN